MNSFVHQKEIYKEDYAKSYGPQDSVAKRPFKVGEVVVICEKENSIISLQSLKDIGYECPFCHNKLNEDLIIIDSINKSDVKPGGRGKLDENEVSPPRQPRGFPAVWTGLIVIFGFCFILTILGIFLFVGRNQMVLNLTPTLTFTPISTSTSIPTNTPVITSTPTPFPNEFTDNFGASMRLISEGEFTMGSNGRFKDERPVHTVYLDAYYIDKYEVTNASYEVCVNDGVCSPPQNFSSGIHSSYYGDSQYSNYPVIYVDWYQSETYCEWRGARLPTEAEWEKAARGMNEYDYPWGNNFRCGNGNFDDIQGLDGYIIPGGPNCDGYEDTAPIGSFGNGKSPFGIYDMAGNVWEWTLDWYDGNYYLNSSYQNPQGPSSGNRRVIRGGAWDVANTENLHTTRRVGFDPFTTGNYLGFRCAVSTP